MKYGRKNPVLLEKNPTEIKEANDQLRKTLEDQPESYDFINYLKAKDHETEFERLTKAYNANYRSALEDPNPQMKKKWIKEAKDKKNKKFFIKSPELGMEAQETEGKAMNRETLNKLEQFEVFKSTLVDHGR